MTPAAPIHQANQSLCTSCHQLGLWPLAFGPDAAPLSNSHWKPFLGTGFAELVSGVATTWLQTEPQNLSTHTLAPGVMLVPGLCPSNIKRLGAVAGLAIDPQGVADGSVTQWLQSQGLDAQSSKLVTSHATQGHSVDMAPAERAMAVFAKQAIDASISEQAVSEFCDRIDDAYDEIKLLYRLAELFKDSRNPRETFSRMCEQIISFSPFGWVAAFIFEDTGTEELSNQPLVSGVCPCPTDELIQQAHRLRLQMQAGDNFKLLNPQNDPLAQHVQAEVFSYRIEQSNKLVGLLLAGNKTGPDPEASSFEQQLLQAATNFMGIFHENAARFGEQRRMLFGMLKALSASIEAKDPYTCGHSERVAELSAQLAHTIGWDEDTVERVRISGLVHDVGKIGVPEAILCKTGRPTDEEFDRIREHPVIGHNILKDIPDFEDVLDGVLHHHERWDGRGYPHKLEGEHIPMIGRVMAVADTFDAMSSSRSYRQAIDRNKVFEEIRRCSGSQFDPQLIDPFLSMDFSHFDAMLNDHRAQMWVAA